jgi:DNA replication and repair protein RecF
MRVTRVRVRDFRCYAEAEAELGPAITVIHGRNGAGKTNLLDAVYLGATGRSSRTTSDRELVRFGERVARVELHGEAEDGAHVLAAGLEPGERRRLTADGVEVPRLTDVAVRPLASVFLPDRLEIVKGAPALRRNHLDQLVTGLWPARSAPRREYAAALAQRNALLARVRAGASGRESIRAWDAQLARLGVEVMGNRAAAIEAVAAGFTELAAELGLDGESRIAYRPRSKAASAPELEAELAERLDSDLARGFTEHGPHRDEATIKRDGRELKTYGSQGEQRLALLALLLAERAALAATRGRPPLMLLDDVMSELDATRRERLVEILRAVGGQSVITTTDLGHVPGVESAEVARIAVAGGSILEEAVAA